MELKKKNTTVIKCTLIIPHLGLSALWGGLGKGAPLTFLPFILFLSRLHLIKPGSEVAIVTKFVM